MNTPIVKLCPKLIIEGTRLTGKTDLAMALNENPRIVGVRKYRYHSPIVSAEWNGFVKNPYGSSLIDFEEAYETHALRAYRIWISDDFGPRVLKAIKPRGLDPDLIEAGCVKRLHAIVFAQGPGDRAPKDPPKSA
jgi:hypothetical protein